MYVVRHGQQDSIYFDLACALPIIPGFGQLRESTLLFCCFVLAQVATAHLRERTRYIMEVDSLECLLSHALSQI